METKEEEVGDGNYGDGNDGFQAVRLVFEFLVCHGHVNVGIFQSHSNSCADASSLSAAGEEILEEGGQEETYDVIVVGAGIAGQREEREREWGRERWGGGEMCANWVWQVLQQRAS
eukprot:758538-Hanusia_phi.AAC.4